MVMYREIENLQRIRNFIQPIQTMATKIDAEAYYPREFLLSCGKNGYFRSEGCSLEEVLLREVQLIEETSKHCMTTGFNLWCHVAAMTYLRQTDNRQLRKQLLEALENGSLLGGTGLSNPMKYYAGMEKLHLKAEQVQGGFVISGQLPSISNLGPDHWFGAIASLNSNRRVMVFVPCRAEGLHFKEKSDYLGMNGSATYACHFNQVFIKDEWLIAEDADFFVQKIRPIFLLCQIPLGLGVTQASIESIRKVRNKQDGCNQYLGIQCEEIEHKLTELRNRTYRLSEARDITAYWNDLLKIRLETAYLTIQAAHGGMLHAGAAGYLQKSQPSRRLREAYFFVNLTPSIKHLEKLLSGLS